MSGNSSTRLEYLSPPEICSGGRAAFHGAGSYFVIRCIYILHTKQKRRNIQNHFNATRYLAVLLLLPKFLCFCSDNILTHFLSQDLVLCFCFDNICSRFSFITFFLSEVYIAFSRRHYFIAFFRSKSCVFARIFFKFSFIFIRTQMILEGFCRLTTLTSIPWKERRFQKNFICTHKNGVYARKIPRLAYVYCPSIQP